MHHINSHRPMMKVDRDTHNNSVGNIEESLIAFSAISSAMRDKNMMFTTMPPITFCTTPDVAVAIICCAKCVTINILITTGKYTSDFSGQHLIIA